MRIGILTLPLHTNYGGILQAYALQTVLERMGHNVEVLQFQRYDKMPKWKIIPHYIKFRIKVLLRHNVNWYLKRRNTDKFIKKYIHLRKINSFAVIKETDYDVIVVGSDQIWREKYYKLSFGEKSKMANAFLSFTKDWKIRRIAYAASFGKSDILEYPKEEIKECREAIQRFNSVSVRENSGIKICSDQFGIDAKWVLDPTMLLKAADYINLIGRKEAKTSNGILMSYVLDENSDVTELRSRIAKDKNLTINISNVADNGSDKRGVVPQPPVEHWLQSFIDADYVINDSFHACVFSILFHKQFTVYGNKVRGMERFTSLLSMFGLQDRLVTSSTEYKPLPDIDYTKVDKILRERRIESLNFLEESLI